MSGFAVGLLVGVAIGLLARPLLSAWLWTRERERVSREAELLRRAPARRRVILPGVDEPHRVQPSAADGSSRMPLQRTG
jgi:hypothetical protein